MRVHVYCASASDSARQLVNGLRAAGVECYRRRRAPIRQLREGDVVVCWGSNFVEHTPISFAYKLLNDTQPMTKLQELEALSAAGVYVPPFSRTAVDGYLARDARHQQGRDLLQGTSSPAFYTKKMEVVREYRVHVADGKSIKVGQKRVRPGCEGDRHHLWVRSYASGWGIYYDADARVGFNDGGRTLAKQAVRALGLQLAAVDLWKLEDGAWCVGEVNRRPALPAGSGVLSAYVKAVCGMVGVAIP